MAEPKRTTEDARLPNRCDVWRQVRYDLFETKDVQDTPTFSYTWIADQGGHFSLGFLPTYVFSWIVAIIGAHMGLDTSGANVWIGLGVFGIWIVKELNDYRLAVRNMKRSKSDFPSNRRELFRNIGTAWLYFGMGSTVAALSFLDPAWAVLSLIPIALIALYVGYRWLRCKITFQQSGVPYLYRLATFPNNIPKVPAPGMLGVEEAKKFIGEMIDPKSDWKGHLILSGIANAGKSTLAVAIATEFVFKLGLCRYLSLVKLLQFNSKPSDDSAKEDLRAHEEFDDGRVLWRWDNVDMLVVDDVEDVARIEHDEKKDRTPEKVAEYNQRVAEALTRRLSGLLPGLQTRPRTVWVCNDPVNPLALKALLEQRLGYTNVAIISLERTMTEVKAAKQLPLTGRGG